MNDTHSLTLYELNNLVRQAIESEMAREYWVEAELSECRESRGHCYMELIEKEEYTNTPIARASAKCWASKWTLVRPYFERTTGQQLHAGLKVRLKVYAQFHEAYGFSWIVTDIDPTFTLGDMARRRLEIIRQLKAEGVFDLQNELRLPLFCQHIAVISSATAAGYGDFCNQLSDSGFAFTTQLFPAIMQGEQTEQSIINALNQIYAVSTQHPSPNTQHPTPSPQHPTPNTHHPFDCVVIIRGGGATADLSGFDTLALAENVAQFPLPIITGIGHERDESILDMVSHTRVKTPTAAAAFLIDHLQQVLDVLNDAQQRIARLFLTVRTHQEARLEALLARIDGLTERRLLTARHQLQLLEQKARSLDPTLLLSRGYSITLKDGKVVRQASQLSEGDLIETRLAQGTITSVVKTH